MTISVENNRATLIDPWRQPPLHISDSRELLRTCLCRGVAEEHGLVDLALETGESAKKQKVKRGEGNSEDEYEGPKCEVNGLTPAVTAKGSAEV